MENTEKKSGILSDLQKLPNKVYDKFMKFNFIKKVIVLYCIYYVISHLTKDLKMNQDQITDNITELPKIVWKNFMTTPTGNKFILVIASWYVVKSLFMEETAVETVKK